MVCLFVGLFVCSFFINYFLFINATPFYGLCRRKATLKKTKKKKKKKEEEEVIQVRVEELGESRGGRPGLPVPKSLYGLYRRKATLKKKMMMRLSQSSGAV